MSGAEPAQVDRALEVLQQGQRFLVTCHRRPDADALGSALGMAVLCEAMGKDATVWIPEPLAPNLQFLATHFQRVHGGTIHTALDAEARFDATLVMDTAANALLPDGVPEASTRGPLVIVDHHAVHDDVGDVVVRDIEASSTAEVVLDLAEKMSLRPVPDDAATPLYAAIVADTGGFRYPVTRSKTLRLGAELLEQGVDPWHTAYELFEGWSGERMKLLGAVLDQMQIIMGGRVALLRITRAMLERVGATDDMVEGMVNYGRMMRGVDVAILLWEFPRADGGGLDTKISLRSSGSADVAAIAAKLGGGGHRAAAGGQVPSSIEETEAEARAAIADVLGLDDG